jgi:hypothetical protein
MILIIGDSNLRNVVEGNQQEIRTKLGEGVVFEQAGTNDSIKLSLDAITPETEYSKIVIGSILNEISKLAKTVKTRDDVINNIAREQAEIIAKSAETHVNSKFIVLPPFMRFEPAWIPDKLRIIQLQLKDHLEKTGKSNIVYAPPIEISEADLNQDNVHLNAQGKAKLLASLIGAPTPSGLAESPGLSNWANTPATRSRTKRSRPPIDSDEEEIVSSKKTKSNDFSAIILAKLNQMTEEMREERTRAAERAETLVDKLETTSEATTINTKKIEELSKEQETLNTSMASLREDVDVVENENMKNVILVRKLKTSQTIPKTKPEINEFLKTEAHTLVSTLGGNSSMIKFVTMAYSELDQTKQQGRNGLVPAFKIGFKNKEDAITFKEKGTLSAKDKDSPLNKVVFAYQQCSATRIRTTIMWIIANKLKAEGKEAWVNMATSKPKLQVKGDKKFPTDYSFVAAVTKFKDQLPEDDLKEVNAQARKFFKGQCKQLFVVLKD